MCSVLPTSVYFDIMGLCLQVSFFFFHSNLSRLSKEQFQISISNLARIIDCFQSALKQLKIDFSWKHEAICVLEVRSTDSQDGFFHKVGSYHFRAKILIFWQQTV